MSKQIISIQTHPFALGNFNCIAINDGNLMMGPTSIFFGGSTPDELDIALKEYNLTQDGLNLACTILFVDTGENRILIDCGSGLTTEHHELGQLFAGLEQEGIGADSITYVLLSHGHWDHVGGCADSAGNLLFPNARFAMMQAEWQHWLDAIPESENDSSLKLTQDRLNAIKSKLDFIEPNEEVIHGIRAINTPGHTAYHISFEITSNDETLICTMDTMDHPLQIEYSTWSAEWDVDPKKSIESRQDILQLATEKNALVHGFHFPFPGLGYITEEGDKRIWKPIN
jgi:glyoxylase-like metal-dependent hydrolase (beta-lactamase superfamily II)